LEAIVELKTENASLNQQTYELKILVNQMTTEKEEISKL